MLIEDVPLILRINKRKSTLDLFDGHFVQSCK